MEYSDPNNTTFSLVFKAGIQIWYTDETREDNNIYGIENIHKILGKKIADIVNKKMNGRGYEIIDSSIQYVDLKILKYNYDSKTGTIALQVKPNIKYNKKKKIYGFSDTWSKLFNDLISNYGEQAGDSWLEGDVSIYTTKDFYLELHLDLIKVNIEVPTQFKTNFR